MKSAKEWFVHVLVGCLLTAWMMSAVLFYANPYFGFLAQMAGTADRPFVYRVLTPMAIRALMALTGAPAIACLVAVQMTVLTIYSKAAWELAGMVRQRGLAWIVSVDGVIVLTATFRHIYDGPTMALWAVALLALYRRQWAGMLLAYGLACLSKETAILFIPIAMLVGGWDWRRLGLMLELYSAIQIPIHLYFANNAGGDMEIHLAQHWVYYPVYIAGLLLIGALLGCRWEVQPEDLRRTLLIFPLFVWLYLIGGFPWELRVFGEIWPALGLAIVNAITWRTNDQEAWQPIHSIHPHRKAHSWPAPNAQGCAEARARNLGE